MNILALTGQARPTTTERGRMFVDKVVSYSPLLRRLNNFVRKATEHQYRPSAGSQTLAAREIGTNPSAAQLSPANIIAGVLSAHGFFLKMDLSYTADMEQNIGIMLDQWYEDELDERAYDTAKAIEKLIIAGSGSSNEMAGIATILDGSTNVPGLGITMVIDALTGSGLSGNSFDLSDEANFGKFLEQLNKWRNEIDNSNALLCNNSAVGRLTTIAMKYHMYTTTTDDFGNVVERIANHEIIPVDDDVITNAEDDNAGTPVANTTSLYLFTNAEGLWNINSNSGLAFYDHGELDGELQDGILFDFRGKNEIKRKRAIRRIRNIKL